MKYHLTLVRMAIKKSTNTKYWRGCREKRTLFHYWWECKLVHYGKQHGGFLTKLKKELPYDPAIPFLGIYPEKNMTPKDICNPIFTVALFTIAKT